MPPAPPEAGFSFSGISVRPIVDNLLSYDPFFLLADYQSYVECQNQVSALWADQQNWTRKSILNVARMGKFSADRSIENHRGGSGTSNRSTSKSAD